MGDLNAFNMNFKKNPIRRSEFERQSISKQFIRSEAIREGRREQEDGDPKELDFDHS